MVMYRNRLWMVLWLLVFTFIIPYPGYSQGIPKLNKEAHRWVMGTINSVGGGSFSIKTKEGTTRNFSIKELEKEKIRNPRVGDLLVMEFEEGNQIIDIDRVDSLDIDPSELGEFHRTILGKYISVDMAKKRVTIRETSKGKKAYQMKDAAATKMNSVKPGTVILLELDEENNMVNDFDIQK